MDKNIINSLETNLLLSLDEHQYKSKIRYNNSLIYFLLYLFIINLISLSILFYFWNFKNSLVFLIYFLVFNLTFLYLFLTLRKNMRNGKINDGKLLTFFKILIFIFSFNINFFLIKFLIPSDFDQIKVLSNIITFFILISNLLSVSLTENIFFSELEIFFYPITMFIITFVLGIFLNNNFFGIIYTDFLMLFPIIQGLVLYLSNKIKKNLFQQSKEKKFLRFCVKNHQIDNYDSQIFKQNHGKFTIFDNIRENIFNDLEHLENNKKIVEEFMSYIEKQRENEMEEKNNFKLDNSSVFPRTNNFFPSENKRESGSNNFFNFFRNLNNQKEFSCIRKAESIVLNEDPEVIEIKNNLNEKFTFQTNYPPQNQDENKEVNNTKELLDKSNVNVFLRDQDSNPEDSIEILKDFKFNSNKLQLRNRIFEIFAKNKKIDIKFLISELINLRTEDDENDEKPYSQVAGPFIYNKTYLGTKIRFFFNLHFIKFIVNKQILCQILIRNIDHFKNLADMRFNDQHLNDYPNQMRFNHHPVPSTSNNVSRFSKVYDYFNNSKSLKKDSLFSKNESFLQSKSIKSKDASQLNSNKKFSKNFVLHPVIKEEEEFYPRGKNKELTTKILKSSSNVPNLKNDITDNSFLTKKLDDLSYLIQPNADVFDDNINDTTKMTKNLNDTNPKIAAILHDFKNVVIDFTSQVFFLTSNLPEEIREKYEEDYETLKILQEYILFLIKTITNYVERDEFFVKSDKNGKNETYDIIKVIEMITNLFKRRLTFDNSLKDHEFSRNLNINFINSVVNNKLLDNASKDYERDMLMSILYNIVSNSYKYCDKGEISIEIFEENDNKSNSLIITIADTGKGIPENILNNWGKPFNLENRNKGSGLGQFIISAISESMGIIIEKPISKIGKGTIFKIKLPLKEYIEIKTEKELIRNNNLKPILKNTNILNRTPLKTFNILCLDDYPVILITIENYLKSKLSVKNSVFNIFKGTSTFEIISEINKLLKSGSYFDFLIFDYNIGEEINGLQLAEICLNFYKMMLKNFNEDSVKVIFLTEENAETFYSQNVDTYQDILRQDRIFSKSELSKMVEKLKSLC